MTTKTLLTLGMGLLLALACGNLNAQTTPTTGNTLTTNGPQAVANTAITNPNVLVVTGKIIDAHTKQPITNAKINFAKFGDELIQASIDEKGNYALALNKTELGDPVRVIFRVAGYKRFIVKNIDKKSTYVDVDVFLQPVESDEKSEGTVTYKMEDSPFNPLVIKLQ